MTVSAMLKAKTGHKDHAVTTAMATATVMQAAKTLATHRIGAIVVAGSDGQVVGILSERDIVRVLAEHGADVLDRPISQFMTKDVKTCTVDSTVHDVMGMMTRGRFRHLPVVDGSGRLTGIVSIGDVVKSHVEEIAHEADTMRDYILTH
jgi:CBS domain-containing protein